MLPSHTSTLFPYTTLFRSLSDGREINQPAQLFEVGRLRVQSFACERADHRALEAPVPGEKLRDVRFNLPGHFRRGRRAIVRDRKSTRLNSSHLGISYAVFC